MSNIIFRIVLLRTLSIIFFLSANTVLGQPQPTLKMMQVGKVENKIASKSLVSASATGIVDRGSILIELELTIPEGNQIYALEKKYFKFEVQESRGVENAAYKLPEPIEKIGADGIKDYLYEKSVKFIVKSVITDLHEWSTSVAISYQMCSAELCYPPETLYFSFQHKGAPLPDGSRLIGISKTVPVKVSDDTSISNNIPGTLGDILSSYKITGITHGYQSEKSFLNFLNNKGESQLPTSLIGIILFVILGGVALNLTPCVLPMIPVNLAIIGAGSGAQNKHVGFFNGSIFGLGMALSYGALGLIAAFAGTTFGALNATPAFNFIIALLFIFLTLSTLGFINIDLTKFRAHQNSGEGVLKVSSLLFMGVVSALLAGACVAPVVISVLLLATKLYSEGNFLGLFLPFLLGIGMALPWPFAGGGIKLLPKPGKWMSKVKYLFAIFIAAMAIYYFVMGFKLLGGQGQNSISITSTNEQSSLAQGDLKQSFSSTDENEKLSEILQMNLMAGKPILVDFWATWCKNCLAMDKQVIATESVQSVLEKQFTFHKYQAETPSDPTVKVVLDHFGVKGLPAFVILEPIVAE